MRKLLTRRELAEALNCDLRTIAKWADEGMPTAQRGRGGRPSLFDLAECQNWKGERDEAAARDAPVDVARERARKERAQAQLAEQLFAKRAGELLETADVEKTWSAVVAAIRAKLLAAPMAYADRLYRAVTLDGLAGAEHVLRDVAHDVLRELAAIDPEPPEKPAPKRRKTARSRATRRRKA